MCVNFTYLNLAYSKDPYLLHNIDRLIDTSLGCKNLIFMDDYSSYNQINMNPLYVPKITFMPNNYLLLLQRDALWFKERMCHL